MGKLWPLAKEEKGYREMLWFGECSTNDRKGQWKAGQDSPLVCSPGSMGTLSSWKHHIVLSSVYTVTFLIIQGLLQRLHGKVASCLFLKPWFQVECWSERYWSEKKKKKKPEIFFPGSYLGRSNGNWRSVTMSRMFVTSSACHLSPPSCFAGVIYIETQPQRAPVLILG